MGEVTNALRELLPELKVFAFSLCGNGADADDIVQETMTTAWEKENLYREDSNLKAWLFAILKNKCLDYYRARKRDAIDLTQDISDGSYDNIADKSEADVRIRISDIQRAILELPEHYKDAIVLVGIMGFSTKEAAQTCNCEPQTMKVRVYRARQHLQSELSRMSALSVDKTSANPKL